MTNFQYDICKLTRANGLKLYKDLDSLNADPPYRHVLRKPIRGVFFTNNCHDLCFQPISGNSWIRLRFCELAGSDMMYILLVDLGLEKIHDSFSFTGSTGVHHTVQKFALVDKSYARSVWDFLTLSKGMVKVSDWNKQYSVEDMNWIISIDRDDNAHLER